MAARIVFHRLAAAEFRSARAWYAIRSTSASERFVESVDRAVQRIIADPAALPTLRSDYRYAVAGRFPYLVIFRDEGSDPILVVAIAHLKRRPGYWRRRT